MYYYILLKGVWYGCSCDMYYCHRDKGIRSSRELTQGELQNILHQREIVSDYSYKKMLCAH